MFEMRTQMPTKEEGLQHLENSNPSPTEAYGFWRRPVGDEQNPGLGQIVGVLRRRVAVIASVAAITTISVAAWTSIRTPKYEGRFQLLVEPLKTSDSELLLLLSETLKQNVNEITRQNVTALDYQALMEVLRSPKVINPVVTELKTQYQDISYDTLVGNNSSGKPSSAGDETLAITRITKGKDESRVIEVRYQGSDPKKIETVLNRVSQAYQSYSVEQQQANLRQGIKFVEQQTPKLRQRVNILQSQLQTFQQRYNLFNPELQGEQLVKRLDQLQTTKLETEKQLAEAMSLYVSLQNQLGMQQNAAIAASALSESPQYQQILTRIREVETKIAAESTRFSDENPIIKSLREEREKLIPLLNREARLALGSNVSNGTLNSQVGVFQNSVRRELIQQFANTTNQIQSLQASLQSTNNAIGQLNELIKEYPAISRQYSNLQRELQVATDTLNQLLSKQEVLRIDAAQNEIPWQLIMPTTFPRDKTGQILPIGSSNSRDIVLGGVAGLLLGVLAAFALDNLENVFHDSEEVQGITKLPLLGLIPYHRQLKHLSRGDDIVKLTQKGTKEVALDNSVTSLQYKSAHFLEAFCSLYTRVQALKSDVSMRSIVVTSATSGEGKSTVAAYLAQIAAEAGQKVLLVDADLQHPHLHVRFGLPNTKGLAEILTQELDLNEAIQQTTSEENLFVLTAGQVPPNPTRLLSSKFLRNFVERSQANFDLVVYDTTHLLGRLDANLLASQLDGVVLVVGLGKILRPNFRQALEESKAARVSVLGVVANNVEG
jgi:polysaccharide biosynthesis transport protein